MDVTTRSELAGPAQDLAPAPVERVAGAPHAGALIVCDHASNAIPAQYHGLGLSAAALERHIAYDIGAAALARALASRLGTPAVLSTFSRLLIDPNRGVDDPTLVMRYSDGAIIPGNARIDAAETESRIDRFWRPYREAVAETAERMIASGEPPAIVSVHSFTPVWRGLPRIWKIGLLWDRDPRLSEPLIGALAHEPDLVKHEVGDNEPYDGALVGDTIDAIATARGLSNTLIEVRQDLIATRADVEGWADRLARLLKPILAEPRNRAPEPWGSRAQTKVGGREVR